MDLEAQGRSEKKRSCQRCFAVNDGLAEFCHECGANLDGSGEGSDSEVYQDLAKANLLRIRGEPKQAGDVCLSILRRYPNNVTAHSLLADIHFEQDDLKQAAEWYEMALDLAPDLARERAMLKKTHERLAEAESKQTVEQLELKPKPFHTWYLAGVFGLIAVVAIAAFAIGSAQGKKSATATTELPVSKPITVPAKSDGTPDQQPPAPTGQALPGSGSTAAKVNRDEALTSALKSGGTKGALVSSVVTNPATDEAIVTASTEQGTHPSVTALFLIGDLFTADTTLKAATIRLTESGEIVFAGSATRAQYDEARSLAGTSSVEQAAQQTFANAWGSKASAGSPIETEDPAGG